MITLYHLERIGKNGIHYTHNTTEEEEHALEVFSELVRLYREDRIIIIAAPYDEREDLQEH